MSHIFNPRRTAWRGSGGWSKPECQWSPPVRTYGWDTHRTNFQTLRKLLPALDQALHALVTDLDDRGLLNVTVVMMGGEFGLTPRIGDITPYGRGHWPEARFLWMAGGSQH